MDPMKEVTAPPLVTMGSSIPTMKRPMMGPVITPVIKVPTSSIPGKYLKLRMNLVSLCLRIIVRKVCGRTNHLMTKVPL